MADSQATYSWLTGDSRLTILQGVSPDSRGSVGQVSVTGDTDYANLCA